MIYTISEMDSDTKTVVRSILDHKISTKEAYDLAELCEKHNG